MSLRRRRWGCALALSGTLAGVGCSDQGGTSGSGAGQGGKGAALPCAVAPEITLPDVAAKTFIGQRVSLHGVVVTGLQVIDGGIYEIYVEEPEGGPNAEVGRHHRRRRCLSGDRLERILAPALQRHRHVGMSPQKMNDGPVSIASPTKRSWRRSPAGQAATTAGFPTGGSTSAST